MPPTPTFKLSRLREIGWSQWDPIRLDGYPEDEYDSYLMAAAARLWRGLSEEEVAAYLVDVETDYMGLSDAVNAHERAIKTVSAVDAYIRELRR